MKPRRIGRPVIRIRRPTSLYRTPDGVTTVEFEIPGHAGWPPCSGLLTIDCLVPGSSKARISVTNVDYPERIELCGPVADPNAEGR
jgi:hypothetical protein